MISRVISARTLKNGGFFFTAGPRHKGHFIENEYGDRLVFVLK